ncbi:dipeptide ABC transporter ATP-binding protein [bacterium]|nr:dipeptide ABC transporter ATP-binding protein [bacterium]
MENDTILKVRNLKKHFPVKSKMFSREKKSVKAVDGVSFELKQGEVLGLVGESGCGKSTLGRTIVRLYDPTEGEIEFLGTNITELKSKDLKDKRKDFQMIFQDPFSSLNPRMTVEQILLEPFMIHGVCSKEEAKKEIAQLLVDVGLPIEAVKKYPHEFSGGQRQRIGIARALALKPKMIVADEAVSALDVSIQSQVLNILKDLLEKYGLSYIFISHDLAVVEHICDKVAVMYLGKIIEIASSDELYKNPRHPYTKALLSAIPQATVSKNAAKREVLEGDVPSPLNPPSGCSFHPRCSLATEVCSKTDPALEESNDGNHKIACHHA